MTTTDAVRALLSWLATYGLHSTLFLGVAWLVCTLRPPTVQRNRERIWKLALVGGLLSATLQPALGARPLLGNIDWRSTPGAQAGMAAPRGSTRPDIGMKSEAPAGAAAESPQERTRLAGPGAFEEQSAPKQSAPKTTLEIPVRSAESNASASKPLAPSATTADLRLTNAAQSSPGSQPPTSGSTSEVAQRPTLRPALDALRERWPRMLLGGWSAIGLFGLVGLLASWTCLRRRMLGRRSLEGGPLVELLEGVRTRARVKTRVRLSVSPRISAPFSTGFFRPEVCVPEAVLTQLTRAQQEALLAHELAHLVRRDPAWFGLSFLIERLFFFQPLNRLARRQLSELAEMACDDWAVRWTGARLALASCLTEVATWVIGERPRLLAPPGLAGQRSRLGQRVERLLDDRRSPASDPPARWWPPLAAGTLTLVALSVPGVSAASIRREVPSRLPAPKRLESKPAERGPTVLAPLDLASERGVLEAELDLLEAELTALHAELAARDLSARFGAALARIDSRMDELRSQHARIRALLVWLSAPNPPVLEPSAQSPAPTDNSGDLR